MLNVFGFHAYTMFVGYCDGVKGFRIWSLYERKVIVIRYITFDETPLQHNNFVPTEPDALIGDMRGATTYATTPNVVTTFEPAPSETESPDDA